MIIHRQYAECSPRAPSAGLRRISVGQRCMDANLGLVRVSAPTSTRECLLTGSSVLSAFCWRLSARRALNRYARAAWADEVVNRHKGHPKSDYTFMARQLKPANNREKGKGRLRATISRSISLPFKPFSTAESCLIVRARCFREKFRCR